MLVNLVRRISAATFASARFLSETEAAMAPVEPGETACPSGLSRSDWGYKIYPF
jgi:hypothetical protein